MLLVLTQSVSISYELGNGWPSCFSLLGLFECYVMSLNVKSKIFTKSFFLIVLCLVFTPLIGYQVSLVDSPIRRLCLCSAVF